MLIFSMLSIISAVTLRDILILLGFHDAVIMHDIEKRRPEP